VRNGRNIEDEDVVGVGAEMKTPSNYFATQC